MSSGDNLGRKPDNLREWPNIGQLNGAQIGHLDRVFNSLDVNHFRYEDCISIRQKDPPKPLDALLAFGERIVDETCVAKGPKGFRSQFIAFGFG